MGEEGLDTSDSLLWDSLPAQASDDLHSRIRASVGEVVRAAGFELLGSGIATA